MMQLSLINSLWFSDDYELLDSGDGAKLERFGSHILSRPEPQALWAPSLSESQWDERACAMFFKAKSTASDDRGEWQLRPQVADQWWVKYRSEQYESLRFTMRLGLTSFKHVGLFPEQSANWEFIHGRCLELVAGGVAEPEVLNLFAYTGGASLAAASGGAVVTHVDSVKQTVSWSRENMEGSSISGIRWVVEDALKFARREQRRGRQYSGIILDPPSYGRGADGEKWVLEANIRELLEICQSLLSDNGFLVLNLYSMGLSALLARTLVCSIFGERASLEAGELYLSDSFDKILPLGVFLRF